VRRYSSVEADLQNYLGWEFVRSVCEILPLVRNDSASIVLLLFRDRAAIAEVPAAIQTSKTGDQVLPEESRMQEGFSDVFSPVLEGRAREFLFGDLLMASVDEQECKLILQDRSRVKHVVPLQPEALNDEILQALLEGFISVCSHAQHVANWQPLRTALDNASLVASAMDSLSTEQAMVGRTLEVIEVQRRWQPKGWCVPFLPTDWEISWRWVDSRGHRHPNLRRGLSRETCAANVVPPCELDTRRFEPSSEWTVQVHGGSDVDGWVYGATWSSPNWGHKATMTDYLRQRKWVRTFV